jgi:hypothetical protein
MRRTISSAPFSFPFRRLNIRLFDPRGDGIGEACDVDASILVSRAHVIVPKRVPALPLRDERGFEVNNEASLIDLSELQKLEKWWLLNDIVGGTEGQCGTKTIVYKQSTVSKGVVWILVTRWALAVVATRLL